MRAVPIQNDRQHTEKVGSAHPTRYKVMRFRLRDLLLLMVMVAVYLTTLTHVLRTCLPAERPSGMFVGLLIQPVFFLATFPMMMIVLHWWAVRKAKPVFLTLPVPIAWGAQFFSLGFTVLIGCIAIYSESSSGLAMFVGASMPFLGYVPLQLFLNTVKCGAAGVAYMNVFKNWAKLEVVRNDDGMVEAFYPFPIPTVAKRISLLRWAVPCSLVQVPTEHRLQVTTLYEQSKAIENATKGSWGPPTPSSHQHVE